MADVKNKLVNVDGVTTVYDMVEADVSGAKDMASHLADNLIKAGSYSVATGMYLNTAGKFVANNTLSVLVLPITGGKKYKIWKATSTVMRVGTGTIATPAVGDSATKVVYHNTASTNALTIESAQADTHMYIQLYTTADAVALRSNEVNLKTLMVYVDQELSDQLAELQEDMERVISKETSVSKDIAATAGTSVQYNGGANVSIALPEGQAFNVVLTSDEESPLAAYAFYYRDATAGTWTDIAKGITEMGVPIVFEAPVDIDAVGMYALGKNVAENATLTLTVSYANNNDTIEDKVATLTDQMGRVLNEVLSVSKDIAATQGTGIQQKNSNVAIEIPTGKRFSAMLNAPADKVDEEGNGPLASYALYYHRKGDAANEWSSNNYIAKGITKFGEAQEAVAPFDIDAVGMYASGGNVLETTTLTLSVSYLVSDDTIENRLNTLTNEVKHPGIVELNMDVEPFVQNIGRKLNTAYTTDSAYADRPDVLTLAHLSDIHGDKEGFARFMEWCDAHEDYLDDRILTGDIVSAKSADSIDFFESAAGHEKVLLTLGNHDQATGGSGKTGDNSFTESEAYEKYIEPYVTNWGVEQQDPADAEDTGRHTYWYKDYDGTDGKPNAGIRLIGLNTNYRDIPRDQTDIEEQMAWFENVLEDARTKNLAVVVAQHYPIDATTGQGEMINCNFNMNDKSLTESAKPRIYAGYVTAVDTFISKGGEFICWIGGHTHCDLVLKHVSQLTENNETVTHEQLSICVTTQSSNSHINISSDTERVVGTKSEDGFNVISFDRTTGLVKLVRIGANSDIYMRPRNALAIRYKPQIAVVSEC